MLPIRLATGVLLIGTMLSLSIAGPGNRAAAQSSASPPPVLVQGNAGISTPTQAAARLKYGSTQVAAALEKPKVYCDGGNKGECLRVEALTEAIQQMTAAERALTGGQSITAVKADYDKIFEANAHALQRAGFNVRYHGDCWFDGGRPCRQIQEIMPGTGMKAVGASWGAFIVVELLTNKNSPNFPK